MKKYRSERKGRRSVDMGLEYAMAAMSVAEKTRTAQSVVRPAGQGKNQTFPPANGLCSPTGIVSRMAERPTTQKACHGCPLVDLEQMVDLWVQHYDKVAESEKRLLPLRPVYYLAPSE